MLDTLESVLSSPDFRAGLPAAGVILLLGVLLVPARRRIPLLPLAGIAVAGGGLVALADTPVFRRDLLVALAVSAAAGLVADVFRLPIPVNLTLAVLGTWLVSQAVAGQRTAGAVVAAGLAGICVTGIVLHIAQAAAGVQRRGDRSVPQRVRRDGIGDPGTLGKAPHDASRGVPVQAAAISAGQQRSLGAHGPRRRLPARCEAQAGSARAGCPSR